jgi:hypothetical protein
VVRQLATGKGFLFSDLGDVVPKGLEQPVGYQDTVHTRTVPLALCVPSRGLPVRVPLPALGAESEGSAERPGFCFSGRVVPLREGRPGASRFVKPASL